MVLNTRRWLRVFLNRILAIEWATTIVLGCSSSDLIFEGPKLVTVGPASRWSWRIGGDDWDR
jgi:hypothetical protein